METYLIDKYMFSAIKTYMFYLNTLAAYSHDKIYHSILLTFILLIGLIYINRKHILHFLQKIDKKTWLFLCLIFILALSIRLFVPPLQHIIYVDEPTYMHAGKMLLQTDHQGTYSKSIGWPFVLRIAFGFFGTSNWVALYASVLLGALTVFTFFFMVYAFTKRKDVALVSALLFSFFPSHVRWSSSAETNVASLFFISLTMFFCFLYYADKKTSLLWLSCISLAFTAQFRPENYALILLFIFGCIICSKSFAKPLFKNRGFYLVSKNYLQRLIKTRFVLPFFLIFVLSFANLTQILDLYTTSRWMESDTGGQMTENNWGVSNLIQNSLNFGINLFDGSQQPVIMTFLMALGLFYLWLKQRKESVFLVIWFVLYWIIYFASWFQTLGGKDRFFMSFNFIIVILASYGMLSISLFLHSVTKRNWIKRSVFSLIVLFVSLLFVPYILDSACMHVSDARLLETEIPEWAEQDIPQNCLIFANYPIILSSTTELNVVSIDKILENPQIWNDVLSEHCVLFLEDYACLNWGGYYNFMEKCDKLKSMFSCEIFKSYELGEYTYTFYRLTERKM